MAATHRVTLVPEDGTEPELVEATRRLLNRAGRLGYGHCCPPLVLDPSESRSDSPSSSTRFPCT